MSKEKLTPVEWLLNELDQRDMIDKTIYHEKDRTFESISEEALKMEEEYASQSKWISVEEEKVKSISEAFSMQPVSFCVGNPVSFWVDNKYGEVKIDTIGLEVINFPINGDPMEYRYYVGRDKNGNKLFQYKAEAVNVIYFPQISPTPTE